MADPLLVGILTWIHVFSVVGWFGAALLFLMVIEPSIPKLSPQASSELVLKVFPRFVRYVQVFATLALVFGVALALAISDGNFLLFGFGSGWGLDVTLGGSFGVVTYLLVFLLLAPSVTSLARMVAQLQQNPGQPPPPEFHAVQERLRYGAPSAVVLLSMAMVFMVAASGA